MKMTKLKVDQSAANPQILPNNPSTVFKNHESSHRAIGYRANIRRDKTMKFCMLVLIVASILVLLLELGSSTSEAKKIKLKDLKKVKKYAHLLAYQNKKFYAIPFPLPLPVFVKRQHIYTHIPIIPRYVQQAPTQQHQYDYMGEEGYASMNTYSHEPQQQKLSAPKGGGERSRNKERSPASSYSQSPSKYLAQLASAVGQAYPLLGNSVGQHDIVGKLLSGQAKVILPGQIRLGSLLSNLKQQDQKQESKSSAANSDTGNNSTSNSDDSNQDSASTSSSETRPTAIRPRRTPINGPHRPAYLYRQMVPHSPFLHPQNYHPLAPNFQLQQPVPIRPEAVDLDSPEAQLMNEAAIHQHPFGLAAQLTAGQPYDIPGTAASAMHEYELDATRLARAQREEELQLAIQAIRHRQALQASLAAREKEEIRAVGPNSLALQAHHLGLPVIHPEHLPY